MLTTSDYIDGWTELGFVLLRWGTQEMKLYMSWMDSNSTKVLQLFPHKSNVHAFTHSFKSKYTSDLSPQ